MQDKLNNTNNDEISNTLIGRKPGSSGRGFYGPRRRWGMIDGKSLPTLAVLSLLALGVAHPFNTAGLWAQEEAANEQPALPRAAVIPDEEQGVIRFVIEGKEVMRLDAAGLHVRDDLNSGGPQTIYGPVTFDKYIAEGADEE